VIDEGRLVNHDLQLQKYIFCTTIGVLRSLAFKVVRLNIFLQTEIAGRKWYYGFKRRYPQLSLRRPHAK